MPTPSTEAVELDHMYAHPSPAICDAKLEQMKGNYNCHISIVLINLRTILPRVIVVGGFIVWNKFEPFLPTSQSLLHWWLELAPLLQLRFLDYDIHKEAHFRKVTISSQLPINTWSAPGVEPYF